MGVAAKRILDGLAAAKVPAASRRRAKDLIDEAHDWDAVQAAEVGEVVRYVCGAGALPPTLTQRFVEHCAQQLLHGLSKGRTLDAWDERALDVVARSKDAYWFWSLDSWLRDRVVAFAAAPIFEEGLALLRARGVWKTEREIVASMVGHLSAHVTEDGALTSTGRWLVAALDRDERAVLDTAHASGKLPRLYRLLLAHRPAVFDRLLSTLQLRADSDKSFLAERLLQADAARFEDRTLALVASLTDPIPAVLSAENLERWFPGKYPADVKRLLLATVRAADTSIVSKHGVRSTHAAALDLAWRVLREGAFELWDAYEEANDAIRLDFYATIEKQAKAKALPWLIDGLVYRKKKSVTYGGVTHAKYVTRMLALLARYDLAPYRVRIEKAFAKTTDRKIREQIAARFATKQKRATPTRPRRAFAAKDGYRFEAYTSAVVKAALMSLRGRVLPAPIESVKLTGMQGAIRLDTLVIEGVGERVEIAVRVGATRVPRHVDLCGGDRVLPRFAALHALEDGEVPVWGDMFELPWCVLLHEQIAAARAIADGLRKRGAKVAKKCRIGAGEHDNFWEADDDYAGRAREEVAALPEAQQADFAAVCFGSPAKQRILLGCSAKT